jgi:hypothetical protein
MKKAVLMLAAGGLMLVTPSCKKGENDPFLSLSSRKARISGEWNVASYEWHNHQTDGSDSWTNTASFDGTNVTTTWAQTVGGTSTSGNGTDVITVSLADFIINKDGTYEMNWNQVEVHNDTDWGGNPTVETTTSSSWETGSWSFIGGAKDEYKKKERVVFNSTHSIVTDQTTTVTDLGGGATTTSVGNTNTSDNTYEIGENATIYDIDMLKGKEMTWVMVSGGTDMWSSTSSGGTTSSTTTSETTMTIQLTAK